MAVPTARRQRGIRASDALRVVLQKTERDYHTILVRKGHRPAP
jgi:hypothetical protein